MTPRPSSGIAPSRAIRKSAGNSKVPVAPHSMTIPAMKPRSPSLVTQNALTAARAADGRSYQKPMSRYEQSPTSSQKTNIWRKVGERTRPIMEKANSEWYA